MKVPRKLAQDRQAWSASIRDVVNSIDDAGSTRSERIPTHVRVKYLSYASHAGKSAYPCRTPTGIFRLNPQVRASVEKTRGQVPFSVLS